MKVFFKFTVAMILLIATSCSLNNDPRKTEDFNFGWKFALGENPGNPESVSFDDSQWRNLHLPHDWAIEGEFSKDNPSRPTGGALPGGLGWYRKHFPTPDGVDEGRRVSVEFDGVFMNSSVYVNGKELGTRPYGYSSFAYDITEYLNADGADNVMAVRCDNTDQPNSRWYAGCGIYRNVRLVTTDALHVAYNGTYVTTPSVHEDCAEVSVQVTVANAGEQNACIIRNTILDAKGKAVDVSEDEMPLARGENICVSNLTIGNPHLWNIEDTYMYKVVTEIDVDGKTADRYETAFGVRTVDWDTDHGLILNGKALKMLGVCLHHDMGCIGSAVHHRALERELGILKDMGVNAIRTSHNPPTPELLQLCDEMGFVVMDEALDMWRRRKTQFDYARFFDEWHVRDVQDFIVRDRNHPCVIMWSIGNEIIEQNDMSDEYLANLTPEQANDLLNFIQFLKQSDSTESNPNVLLTRHLAQLVRDIDPTRAITSGCNVVSPGNNILRSGALDVIGINYHPQLYDSCRVWFPGMPIIGSETVSSLNSRGIYVQPSTKKERLRHMDGTARGHQCTAYDASCAGWANFHEEAWKAVRDREWVAGTFIWTGFDYLGEPTPYGWPSRSSYFGIVDLAGFPKDPYYMYQSEWTDKTVLHLLPHWNWSEGEPVDIWAYYSNADEVELFVNGKSLGRKSKTKDVLHVEWLSVPFESGKIEAVSYKDGKEVARTERVTSGPVSNVRLTADRKVIEADGYDLSYITVDAVDKDGNDVSNATDMLHFEVSGAGELFGIDNGNAADTMCLKGADKALFSGKALAVIRSKQGEKGTATLTVSCPEKGYSKSIKIRCK